MTLKVKDSPEMYQDDDYCTNLGIYRAHMNTMDVIIRALRISRFVVIPNQTTTIKL